MSGRTKRTLYYLFTAVFLLAATAGALLLLYFYALSETDYILFAVAMLCVPGCVPVFVHEAGHLLFGLLAGLRPVSVSLGWLTVGRGGVRFGRSDTAGATCMLPRGGKGVRGRLILFALGGAAMNFILGALPLALFFVLPLHSASLFFGELSLFVLCEGLCALLPAELPAGKTDGEFLLGLIKRTADAELEMRVMTAQGRLYRERYGDLPRELLFGAPVVREDSPAFLALLQLEWRYLVAAGEEDACRPLLRLETLLGYLPAESREEAAADLAYAYTVLMPDASKAETYLAELGGKGTAALRALAAAERTEEAISRARAAAEREPARGERELALDLLERLSR